MNRTIAFFDFDGTLTTKDTLLEFIKFCKGPARFYLGFVLNSPWLIAYKLKLISNQKAKERILTWFFRHRPLDTFNKDCERFATTVIPSLLRPKGLEEITRLQTKNIPVIIVSASPGNWIKPWSDSIGIDLIATSLTLDAKTKTKLTGKITGKNCHGPEKVRRICEQFNPEEYDTIYAYGDTSGDRPMLALAHHAFMKPFR